MKLSVVILNYNVRYFLELCLKSVATAIRDLEAEIIVVDNNSTDESCKMVRSLFPDVKLIRNQDNLGFSKGNNIGVTHAQGEYVCILNPDTVVSENTFKQLIDFADSKENPGLVGCQLIDGTGMFLPESKRNVPTLNVALKKLLGNTKQYYNSLNKDAIGEVEILVGAFMLVKKEVYTSVGGFDEDYFMYGEDIDLSYKIYKSGFKNYYYGKSTVIHFKGESTLRDAQYAKRFYGAMQIFYKKHFKKNPLFSIMVWLGIKLAYVFRSSSTIKPLFIKHTYVISKHIDKNLQAKLNEPIYLQNLFLREISNNSKVVYDLNHLKYEAIIDDMKSKSNPRNIVFRLLPKNSNFIIGSDSAINRGEVIQF
ncbi:MAG: glycosyltransferase family 2 protein [Winogradskyella sp.]|uniref:glycosyltransferase family 2 protein n=1 Tax=Winogradskyella sp. TaxID=1883156 RepID=UPI0018396D1F|nr:glycosyltransferase family 2 protein [Winogradskyella sp.]